ncbi:MAG TPA: hypothetical protein VFS40_03770 [Gemmatimonadales bacterium]|nr:hypothetical protein [Gemmatimonadales bacterium]
MGKAKRRGIEALGTYYAWARALREASGSATGRGGARPSGLAAAAVNPDEAGLALHWCLALHVLVRGYEKLDLDAPEVAELLADDERRACLARLARRARRFRRRPLRKRDAGCLGVDVERWGDQLMAAFGRLLEEDTAPAGAPADRADPAAAATGEAAQARAPAKAAAG